MKRHDKHLIMCSNVLVQIILVPPFSSCARGMSYSPGRPIGNPMQEEEIQGCPVASQFARREITRPEVLRVTRAYQAFQRFAQALRTGGNDDFYEKSFMSKKISSFWSHSWHGSRRLKILTLMILYNGPASVAIGSFAALTMMVLSSLGVLPHWTRDGGGLLPGLITLWAQGAGFIATVMTFLLWRSQRQVFLDRICINQYDEDLKRASIYSLGGIIAKSHEMLILWDSTWSERLWCQYEFSAFLSNRTKEQVLVIRPTFLGPCSCTFFMCASTAFMLLTALPGHDDGLTLFVGFEICLLICGYFMMAALRSYFRMVQELKEKMRSFSFDHSRSACCDVDHTVYGRRIMCDREVVKECVSIWFGDQEAFEDYVRTKVTDNLATELDGVFTRSWSLSVTIPYMWANLDWSTSQMAIGEDKAAMMRFLERSVLWFFNCPIFVDFVTYLTQRFSRKSTFFVCEIIKNLACVLLAMLYLTFGFGSLFLSLNLPWESDIQRTGVFVVFWLLIGVGHSLMKRIVSRHKRGLNGEIQARSANWLFWQKSTQYARMMSDYWQMCQALCETEVVHHSKCLSYGGRCVDPLTLDHLSQPRQVRRLETVGLLFKMALHPNSLRLNQGLHVSLFFQIGSSDHPMILVEQFELSCKTV